MNAITPGSELQGGQSSRRSTWAAKFKSTNAYLWLAASILAGATSTAGSQVLFPLNTDIAVGGNTRVTAGSQNPTAMAQNVRYGPPGGLVSVQEHPRTWAGIDLSFGFNRDTAVSSTIPVRVYEGTGAYLIRARFSAVQPFVGVGDGAIYFDGGSAGNRELRTAGFLEAGLDIPLPDSHIGFRVQGRSFYYKTPTIAVESDQPSKAVVTVEPAASVYFRF